MEQLSLITSGIRISVSAVLNDDRSIIDQGRFFHNYFIRIVNTNPFPVRLLRRHWEIYDSLHPLRHVDGDGVVGLSPVLQCGEHFEYSSGCDLYSEIGSMSGYYVFLRLDTLEEIKVVIPKFDLIFHGKLN